jgi:cell division protein FtsZ
MISILHDHRSSLMETMYISTDRSSVERTRARTKVLIGMRLFGGKGANGYPELGEKAADDAKRDIEPHLAGYGLIVILGTLGKGTGSGALPVIASLAESTGAFVLNICTIPSAVLESLPRTVANHTRNGMVRRGFNIVSVDQDRFLEIYGNQPIHATLASLDALIAGVVTSLSEAIYGNPEKGITVSDLRTLFKEGKEGTLLVGDYDLNDPASAATTFLSTILMKGDVRASKGLLLQMMVPDGAPNGSMRSLLDAIFEKLGERSRTVFISSMRNHESEDRVDLFGIATGIDDTKAQIQKALNNNKDLPKNGRESSMTNRWDVPMVV